MNIRTKLIYTSTALISLSAISTAALTHPAAAIDAKYGEDSTKKVQQITNNEPQRAAEGHQNAKVANENAQKGKTIAAEKKAAKIARLDAKKLELCTKKQEKITTSMQHISTRGLNQIDVFKKIADRTMAFYESKGKTAANYDVLVSDMNTKYEAAKLAVDSIGSSTVFDCSGDNPKEALALFRDASKQKTAALKEYKTSVRNLIVAVKSAQTKTHEPEVEAR